MENTKKLKTGEEAARAVAFFADIIPFKVGEVVSLSGLEELYALLDIDPNYKIPNHNYDKRIFLSKTRTKDGKGFYGRVTQDFGNIHVLTDVINVISFEEVMARMNKAAKTENKNEATSIDDIEKFLDSLTDIYISENEVIRIECADDFKALFGAAKWDMFCSLFWWVKHADKFFIGKEDGKYLILDRSVGYKEVSVSYAIERQINIYKLRDNDKK